jgi:hypothetical protein
MEAGPGEHLHERYGMGYWTLAYCCLGQRTAHGFGWHCVLVADPSAEHNRLASLESRRLLVRSAWIAGFDGFSETSEGGRLVDANGQYIFASR